MQFLFSNYPPMKTKWDSFSNAFYNLIPRASRMDIAVGYVSSDSLAELQKIVEFNPNIRTLNLIIGMHFFDLFTKVQYNAAVHLNNFLVEHALGEVRLVTAFRYHGKMYSYSDDQGPLAGIIGSNNLSSIVEGGTPVYESSLLIFEQQTILDMNEFINRLYHTSRNIIELEIDNFNEENDLLEGHEHVKKVSAQTLATTMTSRTDVSFEIPIKPYEVSPQSNLNVYFGKGRVSKNGLVKPRHWYEVELIVPKEITSLPGYPQEKTDSAIFEVITDDGWTFMCKVSGTNSKNFRSEGDLKILGKWLKGRLEKSGALTAGDPVTSETLRKYGRSSFSLTQTTTPNVWFLDFGVK